MMTLVDKIKVIALVPILLGGAIATMFLSYLLVPLFIVLIIVLIATAIVDINRSTSNTQE